MIQLDPWGSSCLSTGIARTWRLACEFHTKAVRELGRQGRVDFVAVSGLWVSHHAC